MTISKVHFTSQSTWETQKQINDNFTKLDTNKVDKDGSKVLSDKNYTDAEKTKLAGIEAGADVNTIESISVNNVAQSPDANKNVNITVPTTAGDVGALPSSTKYGASLTLSVNNTTYVITAQLKDQDGNNIGTAQTIDLPLESVVVSGSYNSATKKVVLTLQSGSTIEFSVADLVVGLQSEITTTNKLASDLVDDTNQAHKFVSTSEKSTWNGKQDAISDLATIRSNASAGAGAATTISGYGDIVTHNASEFAPAGASSLVELAFTASTGWSELDANGFYTLTIASDKKPLIVYNTNGEQVMAGLSYDGTNIYLKTDTKFTGTIIAK